MTEKRSQLEKVIADNRYCPLDSCGDAVVSYMWVEEGKSIGFVCKSRHTWRVELSKDQRNTSR